MQKGISAKSKQDLENLCLKLVALRYWYGTWRRGVSR